MFIKTMDNKIINLICYLYVSVTGKENDKSYLRAFTVLKPNEQLSLTTECITIAEYDKRVDADYALLDLYDNLSRRESTWDISSVVKISELWDEVKKELINSKPNAHDDLAHRVILSIKQLGKFKLSYTSKFPLIPSERLPGYKVDVEKIFKDIFEGKVDLKDGIEWEEIEVKENKHE